jgi:selenide,water dikinase
LANLLGQLPGSEDPNLLVGFNTSDDAGVYKINQEQALVVTADFITPPVDDPFRFGQIAAANALSDVYAMGGKPLICLNLACFPDELLGPEVLRDILAGAQERINAAGAVLAGGHTVSDNEPKFGLAVTGMVHPERYWSNATARPGDVLILTKPIGSGVLLNANLKGKVSAAALESCLNKLIELNATAAEVLQNFQVHSATDVTGYGLAGHALEIARASRVSIKIDSAAIRVFDEALAMYRSGVTTGVNHNNMLSIEPYTRFSSALTREMKELLVDPQTSGGLLVLVPADKGKVALTALHEAGVSDAHMLGEVEELSGETFLQIN